MQEIIQEHKHEQGIIEIPTLSRFIEKCLGFNEAHPEVDISKFEQCPVHVYATQVNKPCKVAVPGIRFCPVCQKPMCPSCGNHNVTQISRVTGYMSSVEGWNQAKRQELLDRRRYDIGAGGDN